MPHFKLRLPSDLLDRIRKAAEEAGRTQTNEMVRRLEASFAEAEPFPPQLQRDLQRYAAKATPPKTARALAIELVQDAVERMKEHDAYYEQREREDKADIHSLTDAEFDNLLKFIEAVRSKDKPKAATKPPAKRRK
jgi:Arc-like DNA binding domain